MPETTNTPREAGGIGVYPDPDDRRPTPDESDVHLDARRDVEGVEYDVRDEPTVYPEGVQDSGVQAEHDVEVDRGVPRGMAARSVPRGRPERSIADLLKELRDESSTLVRQEVALAKTELSEKATILGRNVAYIAVGGAVALLGSILLLHGIAWLLTALLTWLGLSLLVSTWLSFLLVGAIVAAIGYGLIQKGLSTLKNQSLTPENTVASLQEDKAWLANKVK